MTTTTIPENYKVTIARGKDKDTDWEIQTPVSEYQIKYYKANAGYSSYYYLSCTNVVQCVNKKHGYRSTQMIIDFTPKSIPLVIVKRKTAKVHELLNKWLDEHAKNIHASFNFAIEDNMLCVYNYVKSHLPERNDFDMFGINVDRYKKMHLLPFGYYALTPAWVDLAAFGDDKDAITSYVETFMAERKDDYKAMTELDLTLNWMFDLVHADEKRPDETKETYRQLAIRVHDWCIDNLTSDEAAGYHFEMTD